MGIIPFSTHAKGGAITSRLAAYDGKSYTGFQDPEYLSYDQALRDYMVKRISKRCGLLRRRINIANLF
jgi:hypothetical protein